MADEKVSSSQIYALQAVFTLAYVAGIALAVGFIAGAFLLVDWALSFLVIDLLNALSITIYASIISKAIAFLLVAISLVKSSKKLKAQLVEYWLMIVNIKYIKS